MLRGAPRLSPGWARIREGKQKWEQVWQACALPDLAPLCRTDR